MNTHKWSFYYANEDCLCLPGHGLLGIWRGHDKLHNDILFEGHNGILLGEDYGGKE